MEKTTALKYENGCKCTCNGNGKADASPLRVRFAGSAAAKVKGFLFASPTEEVLVMMPCADVHTVGMKHCLDIAFVDADGQVIEAYRRVGPCRRLKEKSAVAVFERFSTCESPWFAKGDRIAMTTVPREGEVDENMPDMS